MMQNSTAKKYIDNFIGTQVPLYNSTLESEIVTQDKFMHEVEKYMTYKISMAITTYWFPILVPVGFIGNIKTGNEQCLCSVFCVCVLRSASC